MAQAIDPKPGDVFALPSRRDNPPQQVTIERLTATQAIDTKGRRWNRTTGYRVGDSLDRIRPWTDADTAEVEEHERAAEYRRCLDALGAAGYYWQRLPTGERLAAALPHLRAAVAALAEPEET